MTLAAGTTYAVMSQEVIGGDDWYDYGNTQITLSGDAGSAWAARRANNTRMNSEPRSILGVVNVRRLVRVLQTPVCSYAERRSVQSRLGHPGFGQQPQ